MHRPVWKAIALTATALALAACGSDSTGPSTSTLTDVERASLISAFTKLHDSLDAHGAVDVSNGIENVLAGLATNSDVAVATISAPSLRRVAGNVSALTENTALSGSFRVIGFRAASADPEIEGDSLVTSGLIAWQDSSVVIFAMKDGDAPWTIDGDNGQVGIFVAPMSAWGVTAGSLTASETAQGGTCAHNPAAALGIDATCHYNTMSIGLDMTGSEPASFEGNDASGSLTGRIAPMTVPGVSFAAPPLAGRRASLFARTAR